MLRFKKDDGTSYPEWEESQLEKYCYSISSGKTKTVESKGRYILYGSTGEIGRTNNEEFSGEYVLVARVGANAGTVNLRKGSFGVSDNTIVIKNKETISSSFLYYLLYKYNLKNLMFGSGQPLITSSQLKKLKLKIPHMEEQQKIADFLLEVDNIIASSEQEIESLEMQKKGAMQKIFSQEVRFKTDDGSEYPEWEEKKLGEYILVQRGGSPRPIDAYLTDEEEGVNWIKIGDAPINGNIITSVKEKIRKEGVKKSREVYVGDLILSNSMSFGRPYILGVNGCIHDGWLLLRDEKKMFVKKYLCYLLSSDKVLNQYRRYAAGSTVNNLNSDLVQSVLIDYPSLEEQQKIADFLSEFDNAIEYAKEELEVWKNIKKGLLQQMFE